MTRCEYTAPLRQSLRCGIVVAALVLAVPMAQAYEVWVTDQSDTAKESGGFLHIYDGAKLAADPLQPGRYKPSTFQVKSAGFVKRPHRKPSAAPTCSSSTRAKAMSSCHS